MVVPLFSICVLTTHLLPHPAPDTLYRKLLEDGYRSYSHIPAPSTGLAPACWELRERGFELPLLQEVTQ